MKEKIVEYISWLYSKNHNATATAINETLNDCDTEDNLQNLWNDIRYMYHRNIGDQARQEGDYKS